MLLWHCRVASEGGSIETQGGERNLNRREGGGVGGEDNRFVNE